MLCTKCGKEIEGGVLFCPHCGEKQDIAAVAQQKQKEKESVEQEVLVTEKETVSVAPVQMSVANEGAALEKPKKKKKWLFIPVVILFVALVALIIFLINSLDSGKNDKYVENALDAMRIDDRYYLWNEQGKYVEIEDVICDYKYSGDHSVMAYLIDLGVKDLYYIDEDMEPEYVAENVESYAVSYDGEYILYIDNLNEEGTAGDLYLYCIESGKATEIDNDVYPDYYVLSPNGKNVAYVKDYEGVIDNTLYLAGIKKDPEKIDKDGSYPVAVKDNGKGVYYVTANSRLYFYNDDDAEKIASDLLGTIYVNKDMTEYIFNANEKTYFYSEKMEEPVKICSHYFEGVIVPENIVQKDEGVGTRVVGKDTFENSVIMTEGGLYWFEDKETDGYKIMSSYDDCRLAADEKSLIYLDDGELYKIEKFGEDMDKELLFDDEYVDDFFVSDDLSKVYVVIDEELHYVKKKNKTELITDELYDTFFSVKYDNKEDKIFFIEEEDLVVAKTNGKSKEKVDEKVEYVYGNFNITIYIKVDEETELESYYIIKDGEPIKLFAE